MQFLGQFRWPKETNNIIIYSVFCDLGGGGARSSKVLFLEPQGIVVEKFLFSLYNVVELVFTRMLSPFVTF